MLPFAMSTEEMRLIIWLADIDIITSTITPFLVVGIEVAQSIL